MKVKVGDTVYECTKDQPIMVILADQDKKNIANMAPEASKYAIFSDDYGSAKTKLAWMREEE